MAGFSELIIAQGLENAKPQELDIVGNAQRGAAIALQREQLEQEKVKQEQAMRTLESAKMEKFVGALQAGAKYEGQARSNYFNKWLPTYRDSLGLTEAFPNESLKFATATPENLARLNTLVAQVRDPESGLTEAEALAIIQDPSKFADIPPEVLDEATAKLADAAKTKITAAAQRSQMQQSAQQFREGQRATEERSQRENQIQLTNKLNDLGIPSLKRDINKLDEIVGLDSWEEGTDIPGVTGAEAKVPMNKLSQKSVQVRQAAQGVANQILKLRSGGAVSDGEANRLLKEIGMTASVLEDGSWTTLFTGSPTPQTFITGMRGVRDKIGAVESSLRAGYGADVYDRIAGTPLQAKVQAMEAQPGTQPNPRMQALKTNPTRMEQLKSIVSKSTSELNKAAQALGLTPQALKAELGL